MNNEPQTLNSQLRQYLSEAISDINIDPLQWWKENYTRFPLLALMSRDYLAIQASSVPSEQTFSEVGQIVTAKRNRLSDTNIQMLTCLSSWDECGIPFKRS